jgi:hypothetical protein
MNSPFTAVENPLISALLAARDSPYRSALWASAAFTSGVVLAAFFEWAAMGSATLLSELLVLIESAAIYSRAALAPRLNPHTDASTQFLTGIGLGSLAVLTVLNSLTRILGPVALDPVPLLRLFSLAVTIELFSILLLLENRRTIVPVIAIFRARAFAWAAHCALLFVGLYSAISPVAKIDGALALCVATICFLSAAEHVKEACHRMGLKK